MLEAVQVVCLHILRSQYQAAALTQLRLAQVVQDLQAAAQAFNVLTKVAIHSLLH
jgi:hypothetical protein